MSAVLRLGWHRTGVELRQYVRSPDTVVLTFLFPVLMLTLFTLAYGVDDTVRLAPDVPAVPFTQLFLPGMLAAGLLLSGFQNLAVDIAVERSQGLLKRLGGTPLSPVSYFVGKVGQVAVTGVLQAGILLAVAAFAFDVPMPATPAKWATLAWVFVLGITASATLGVALSALPRSAKGATAVVVPLALALQFVSGVYLVFSALPDWLQTVAGVFWLKWMAQGMRAVFLPDEYAALEQGGTWNLPAVAIALVVWIVAGLGLSLVTFRWNGRDK